MQIKSFAVATLISIAVFAAIVPSAANQEVKLDTISSCYFTVLPTLPPGQIIASSTIQNNQAILIITTDDGKFVQTYPCENNL